MLFLDTEFNGFGGQLISMGICSSETNKEFYEVLELPSKVHPWVQEHVVPFLIKDPISYHEFSVKLRQYLNAHTGEPIFADWPEDLTHLLTFTCGPDGYMWKIELVMYLIQSGKLSPTVPHNAISDARALRDWYMNQVWDSFTYG